MSKASAETVKGESRSCYRLCVPSCPRYITSGDKEFVRGLLGSEARRVGSRGSWLFALWENATAYAFAPGKLSLSTRGVTVWSGRGWQLWHRFVEIVEETILCPLICPTSDYYGNVAGLSECGYRAMPRVEQTLASYLSPDAASSLKAPVLRSKPLCTTSALLGKGYTAAGQAGRAVVKSTFVESKTSPSPKRFESESSQVRVQRGSSPSQVQVQMRRSKLRKKKMIFFKTTYLIIDNWCDTRDNISSILI